jgi:hypothetical protein
MLALHELIDIVKNSIMGSQIVILAENCESQTGVRWK